MGDFSGLDDLDTTNPKVMEVMLDIYKYWIEEFDVDGYRIDTARHVNDEFWAPFLTEIYDHATKLGKNNFYIFGEASYLTPDSLAAYQRRSEYTHLLDFPFSRAAIEYFLGNMTADAFSGNFYRRFNLSRRASCCKSIPNLYKQSRSRQTGILSSKF